MRSEGTRPHTRHACRSTNSGDPYRAGEPFFPKHGLYRCEIASVASIDAFWRGPASDAPTPRFCRDGMSRLMAARIIRHRTRGRTVTSPMRGADRGESCPNCSSTIFASAVDSVFLAGDPDAPSRRPSAELIAAICSIRLS
jgi:hypothetical protein